MLTLPAPVADLLSRDVTVAGRVQVGVVADFSLQALTSHELGSATAAAGVM